MADRILVVDPDRTASMAMVAVLAAEQYDATGAADVVTAMARLNTGSVDLLITVVRPGVFNGMALVMRGCADNPRMAALVIHDSIDAVTDHMRETRHAGEPMHVARSIDRRGFLHHVAGALATRERRRWSRAKLDSPLTVHTMAGRARALDVSYDGLRLEFPRERSVLPAHFHVELPSLSPPMDARLVWRQTLSGVVRCGTALDAGSLKRALRWREIVDSLRSAAGPPPHRDH